MKEGICTKFGLGFIQTVEETLISALGSCQRYARRLQGRNVGKKLQF
jgi:hypothetical protein